MAEIRVEKRYLRADDTWTHWQEIPLHSAVALLESRYINAEHHLHEWCYVSNSFAEYRIIPPGREESERDV